MTSPPDYMGAPLAGRPPHPAELLRLQRGITRRAISAATGLNLHTLYHIEKGHVWPMPPTILRMAAALGLTVEDMTALLLRGWLAQHGQAQPESHP